ncbi:MAG TPA: prepilin-type N-terminal cleavage/methylation domain-containing protein [Chthoniobacteraceae bacterium]|jgi:prepilin-type N-terminal cleavage/methylation domain-containing protein
MKTSKTNAFTLIELLVVISIIAILAGIALPVFGEVQVRGAQTSALSNAKQVGLACKLFAADYNGNFPLYSDPVAKTEGGGDSNSLLQTLIPDYIPDKKIFAIPRSAYCKGVGRSNTQPDKLGRGENEWAYVKGLSDTSNARFPLLADGFSGPGSTTYVADESQPGGVWKGKKAIVIRVDTSGAVETLYKRGTGASVKSTVKRSDDDPTKDAFQPDPSANPPWLTGSDVKVLNPIAY